MKGDALGLYKPAFGPDLLDQYRLAIQDWSPSSPPDQSFTSLAALGLAPPADAPTNPEVEFRWARYAVERYGGWECARALLAALVKAIDALEVAPDALADHLHFWKPITSDVRGVLYEAAGDAYSSLQEALRAEAVLGAAGYKSSGPTVVTDGGTRGRPKTLFREEVERELALIPGRGLGRGNTAPNRRVIGEKLQDRWRGDPRLEDGGLRKVLKEILREERKQRPPRRRFHR